MFVESYRQLLAKRLLAEKSINNAFEMDMITMLKMRCGATLTQKLEAMFNNLEVGKTAQGMYAEKWAATGASINFSVQVLQTGVWPSFFNMSCHIPRQLACCMAHFQTDYKQLHESTKVCHPNDKRQNKRFSPVVHAADVDPHARDRHCPRAP